jgi:hypothetical protein
MQACIRSHTNYVWQALPLPAIAVASPLFALIALFYSMVCLFVVYASAARACDTSVGQEAEGVLPQSSWSLPLEHCESLE